MPDHEMTAREHDAAVAKAMGWHFEEGPPTYVGAWFEGDKFRRHEGDWDPWTSDHDALMALDAALAKRPEWVCELIRYPDRTWAAKLWRFGAMGLADVVHGILGEGGARAGDYALGFAPIRPQAICLALEALGKAEAT